MKPAMVSCTSSATCAASIAAREGFAVRPAMARASTSEVHTQRMPRLKARSSTIPRSWSIMRGGRAIASRPCRCSVTTATWRTSRGPSGGGALRGSGVSAAPAAESSASSSGGAACIRWLARDSDMLRASGTAACVRASSAERSACELPSSPSRDGGGSLPTSFAPCGTSCAIVVSSADASMSSPCRRIARPSAADSSRPVGKRSSRAGASARMTICSSSAGTSLAYVVGGSTMPERTMSSSASPPRPPCSGRPPRISQRMTPSA